MRATINRNLCAGPQACSSPTYQLRCGGGGCACSGYGADYGEACGPGIDNIGTIVPTLLEEASGQAPVECHFYELYSICCKGAIAGLPTWTDCYRLEPYTRETWQCP